MLFLLLLLFFFLKYFKYFIWYHFKIKWKIFNISFLCKNSTLFLENKGNIKYNLSAEPNGEAQPSQYLHFTHGGRFHIWEHHRSVDFWRTLLVIIKHAQKGFFSLEREYFLAQISLRGCISSPKFLLIVMHTNKYGYRHVTEVTPPPLRETHVVLQILHLNEGPGSPLFWLKTSRS